MLKEKLLSPFQRQNMIPYEKTYNDWRWLSDVGTSIVYPHFDVCFVSKQVNRDLVVVEQPACSLFGVVRMCMSLICSQDTSVSCWQWVHCAGTQEIRTLEKGTPSSMNYCLRKCKSGSAVIQSSTGGNRALYFRTSAFGHQTVGCSANHWGQKTNFNQLKEH